MDDGGIIVFARGKRSRRPPKARSEALARDVGRRSSAVAALLTSTNGDVGAALSPSWEQSYKP